ncbi:MBL fold metallo-hydrolase [Roseibium sediminicola]|uniref:MBL fold metallo-hydrolase n=1 Tax=Roseibium sediminicola TaxID=2933272 RepID=A0ABT0H163_9HYPH|nr:MBL fold metallo-hydrolase [Roseibium sp. CAU 1639]MCK7615409.1 MBL fold metallo-hydrolase [Roseibium sp. CAU 1639]
MSASDFPDRLVILGSKGGPAIRPGGPSPTSSLLDIGGRRCVVDCGLGVTRGLINAGVVLKELDLIFITHMHSDHVLELGPLIHTAWTTGLSTKVKVFGPADLKDYWDGFLASMRYDIDLRIDDEGRPDLRDLVAIHLLEEGEVPVADNAVSVSALRVDHPPVVDCFALRFDVEGWSVAFSADTTYFPPLGEFSKDCDLLIHEAMLARGVDRIVEITGNGERLREHLLASHTMAHDAARIAQAAGVKKLVLHHLIPADLPGFEKEEWLEATKGFQGETIVSHDGLAITRS